MDLDKITVWKRIIDYENLAYKRMNRAKFLELDDMVRLVEEHENEGNITLKNDDNLDEDISGYICKLEDNNYKIIFKKENGSFRHRFTVAHELGHYVLHRVLLGKYGTNDDITYRTKLSSRHYNKKITIEHEKEANNFARHFLLPKQLIACVLGTQTKIQEIIKYHRHDMWKAMIKNNEWLDVKSEELHVSKTVLQLRLGENDLNEFRGDDGYFS